MLAIRLPTDSEERLDRSAKATGRTKTFCAHEVILEHLDELEDLYLAEQGLIDNRAERSRTYSWRRWRESLASRPAVSNERLSVNDRRQVVYRLKHPFSDGTTHVVLDPIEFMRHIRVPHPFGAASGCANRQSCRFGIVRLATPEVPLATRVRSVPRPRAHLIRYHGVFAPNFNHRHRIIPNPVHQSAREPQPSRPAPMRWMQRLKRVFHIDIEHCGLCGGTLRVIACIEPPLKCRSLRELAHSSTRSSPISPSATPSASTAPAHRRCTPRKPNSRPPPSPSLS